MFDSLLRDFLMMWTTIDPVGTLGIFLAVTTAHTKKERRAIALRSILYSAAILMGFLVAGQIFLDSLGIHLASFQVAGGIILFLFGLQMIFKDQAEYSAEPGRDVAVFPLAIPSIASPGAIMAVVMVTDNDRFGLAEQALTALIMLAVLGLALLGMWHAHRVHRVIGENRQSGCHQGHGHHPVRPGRGDDGERHPGHAHVFLRTGSLITGVRSPA